MSIRIALSHLIYPHACLEETIVAYQNLCSVVIAEATPEETYIDISAASASRAEDLQVVREFLNYLLELSLDRHLAKP